MFRQPDVIDQRDIIHSYNLLVDAMHDLRIKTRLKKLGLDGACNGLTYGYKFYAHQGLREAYVLALVKLTTIKDKSTFIRLLQYKPRPGFFEVNHVNEKHNVNEKHLISINKIIAMLEGIHLSQANQSLKEIEVLWDKTYTFLCQSDELAAHLKNAGWQDGDSAFMNMGLHVFYIEKSEEGFYLFEVNGGNIQFALRPEIKNEEQLAGEIIKNTTAFINNDNVAFAMQFVSYASRNKNTVFDYAMLEMDDEINTNFVIKDLCDEYCQRKISRLDCALAIKGIGDNMENISPKFSQFLETVNQCIKSENTFIKKCNDYNGDINATAYQFNMTMLYLSSMFNQITLTDKLLDNNKIAVNQINSYGFAPLHVACSEGFLGITDLLLTHAEIEVNLPSKFNDLGPLHLACLKGHANVAKFLLELEEEEIKVKVNQENSQGSTPLHLACQNGNADTVKLLLERDDIKINLKDNNGETPLHIAIHSGHANIVKLLVNHKRIKVNERGFNKAENLAIAPLCLASRLGHEEIVISLLANKALVNEPSSVSSQDMLNHAEDIGKYAEFTQLLKNNHYAGEIDDYIRNFTPLHAAIFYGHTAVAKTLIEADANVDAKFSGISCFELAQLVGNEEIEQLLTPEISSHSSDEYSDDSSEEEFLARRFIIKGQ